MVLTCPDFNDVTITIPDEWLGRHAMRHEQAQDSGKEMPAILRDFAVVMALLDDWNIPHMPANPDEWDIEKVPIRVMVWAREVVFKSFYKAFEVPKNSSAPLPDG
jgi:hypothetical protein